MTDVGKTIKFFREKKGLSINKLASQLNVSPSTLRDWEHGRAISGEPYTKIASILEISLSELLGYERSEIIKQVNQISLLVSELDRHLKTLRGKL